MKAVLVAQSSAPWSRKARWALDYHAAPYDWSVYRPLHSELWLRWKLWQWTGQVSVPVLLTAEGNLTESLDIAKWAEAHTTKPESEKLFPEQLLASIARWDARGATLLACNRCEIFKQLLSSPSARLKLVPPFFMWLPYFGPWLGQALVKSSVEGYQKKYADASAAATFNKVRSILQDLKATLDASQGDYILGKFTYADMSVAIGIQKLVPAEFPRKLPAMEGESPNAVQKPLYDRLFEGVQELVPWSNRIIERCLSTAPL